MNKKLKVVLPSLVFLNLFIFLVTGFCANPPATQTIGGQTLQEKEIIKKRELEKKIESEKPRGVSATEKQIIPEDTGPKIMVKTIKVERCTLLTPSELQSITAAYEGKELSIKTMQKIADLISDEYRKKGYATSRAYLPPQTIKDGLLIIRVIEGKVGGLEFKGNRYFKTSALEKKVMLNQNGYFDYSALQKSLVYINQHPDRKAKATLAPGKEPGTTDVIIEVEDRLPFHAGFEYDNYGSRYIGKNRYSLVLEHNNMLGFDDKAYFKLQYSDSSRLQLQQFRYLFPITQSNEIGFYFLNSKLELGKEFEVLEAEGKAQIFGLFLNQWLLNTDTLDLRCNIGFDYKNIKNYLLGSESSRDKIRVLKGGLDVDLTDVLGRNILTTELDIGLPDFMGGMSAKDSGASRAGAGGKFVKGVFNYFRLQQLPFSTTLLWKNSAQFTNYTLPAAEQFQIGGAISVRGYPPAEFGGDSGFYTAPELSLPIYGLSKELTVPFNKEKLYDSLRFVLFYDWATTYLNTLQAGEEKRQTLKGYGFGLRFNLRDNLSFRVEVGYPTGKKASDGDSAHPWIELVSKF